LLQAIKWGVPFLYWLHRMPTRPDCWEDVETRLGEWLNAVRTLDGVPAGVYQQRIGKEEFAYHATLMWDDPEFNPFSNTNGAKFK
jgi:hypothetical protein